MAEAPDDNGLEKSLQEEIMDMTPLEETLVTRQNLHMLTEFLRVNLGLHFKPRDQEPSTIAGLLNAEEIAPNTLTVALSTHPEQTVPMVRVLTERWKNPLQEHMKPCKKQKVCLHPAIEMGVTTFGSIVSDIIERLEESPKSAMEALIKLYYEEYIPTKLKILPSTDDNVPIESRFPGFKVSFEQVTIPDPQDEAKRTEHYFKKLAEADAAIRKYLNDPAISLVALEYSAKRPMVIRICKLVFQAHQVMQEQLLEDFTLPENVQVKPPPSKCVQVHDEFYGLQAYTERFTNEDIQAVRKILLQASAEYASVYIDFLAMEKTGGGAIIRIHGKR